MDLNIVDVFQSIAVIIFINIIPFLSRESSSIRHLSPFDTILILFSSFLTTWCTSCDKMFQTYTFIASQYQPFNQYYDN